MIDQDRMEGGAALASELRGSRQGGIPWSVILDEDGKERIDATGPKGNIGCPAQPHEIDHFMVMLDKTRRHMSELDRQVIERELRAYGQALTSQRKPAPGHDDYMRALRLVKFGRFEEATHFLEKAFAAGFPPERILVDKNLWALREDPDARPRLVTLAEKSVKAHHVVLVEAHERGRRIRLRGRVVDMETGEPLPGTRIRFSHTDASGEYRPFMDAGQGAGNPRLWGFVLSDAEARFVVDTIMPERYVGASVPRHVHYRVWAPHNAVMDSECFFDEDPLLSDEARKSAPQRNFPIVKLTLDDAGHLVGDLVIRVPKA